MPAINARFDLRGRVMAITGGDRQGVWATAAVGGYEATRRAIGLPCARDA